jgi:hypothetical protein
VLFTSKYNTWSVVWSFRLKLTKNWSNNLIRNITPDRVCCLLQYTTHDQLSDHFDLSWPKTDQIIWSESWLLISCAVYFNIQPMIDSLTNLRSIIWRNELKKIFRKNRTQDKFSDHLPDHFDSEWSEIDQSPKNLIRMLYLISCAIFDRCLKNGRDFIPFQIMCFSPACYFNISLGALFKINFYILHLFFFSLRHSTYSPIFSADSLKIIPSNKPHYAPVEYCNYGMQLKPNLYHNSWFPYKKPGKYLSVRQLQRSIGVSAHFHILFKIDLLERHAPYIGWRKPEELSFKSRL